MPEMILMIAVMIAAMYFLMIRPQSKRAKAQQEALAALQVQDRVLLHSGIFGTISHIGETQMIIELAPGAEITILKAAVSRKAKDDEEEFVFADDMEDSPDSPDSELNDELESAATESVEATTASTDHDVEELSAAKDTK